MIVVAWMFAGAFIFFCGVVMGVAITKSTPPRPDQNS